MTVRKLLWLGTRLLGYRRRPRSLRREPDGALLGAEALPPSPVFRGAAVRRLQYVSEGLAVTGYALHPPVETGPLPVLLYARGGLGPHGALEDEDFDLLAELCTRGPFLGLATEYRGNVGGDGDDMAGEGEARDLANLLALAAHVEDADPDRALALGFSRGGTMVLMAARAGMRIRAAATIGGVMDLARAFEEGDVLLRSAIRVSTGGRPTKRRVAAYAARSPYLWADEIPCPLLLLAGDDDETIRVSQSLEMAARLKDLGKPHRLVVLPGGDHKLLRQPEARAAHLLDWFRAQLA